MRCIYLLRHGTTEANERHIYCGATDLPLSDGGIEALKQKKRDGGYPSGDNLTFFTSGMRRTVDTLQILYGQVPWIAVPGLREMDFGDFELHSYEELRPAVAYQAWLAGDNYENRCPGGESGRDMEARVLDAFGALPQKGDLLLVLHGGPIAAIMAALFPEAGKNRYQWQPKNGCGYQIIMDGPTSFQPIPAEE